MPNKLAKIIGHRFYKRLARIEALCDESNLILEQIQNKKDRTNKEFMTAMTKSLLLLEEAGRLQRKNNKFTRRMSVVNNFLQNKVKPLLEK